MANTWMEALSDAGRLGRWLARLPLSWLWAGLGVFGAIGLLYAASAAALGQLALFRDAGGVFGLDPRVRFDLVLAMLVGYTVAVERLRRAGAVRDLLELRPTLKVPAPELTLLLRRATAPEWRPVALAMLAGTALGLSIELAARRFIPEVQQRELGPLLSAWGLVLNAVLFALLGRMGYLSIYWAHVLSDLGRNRVEVRLLDPDSGSPFARAGLRTAVFWLVGSSIASLLMLDAMAPGFVLLVLAMTVTLGVMALLLPATGIHAALQAAKRAELSWLRTAIEAERDRLARAERDRLARAEPPAETVARLPALLAYEARVQAVREWPFDTSTLMRFSLFLLLPLASWIGGALVERVVDVVLE